MCGLKLINSISEIIFRVSHPSWVCGLKLMMSSVSARVMQSHPSWVCGLKQTTLSAETDNKSHILRGCVD